MKPALLLIRDMEATAADEFDSRCSKLVRGELLQVERCLDKNNKHYFEYTWGKNKVSREVAVILNTLGWKPHN